MATRPADRQSQLADLVPRASARPTWRETYALSAPRLTPAYMFITYAFFYIRTYFYSLLIPYRSSELNQKKISSTMIGVNVIKFISIQTFGGPHAASAIGWVLGARALQVQDQFQIIFLRCLNIMILSLFLKRYFYRLLDNIKFSLYLRNTENIIIFINYSIVNENFHSITIKT